MLPATETHAALAAIVAAGEAAVSLFADAACQRPLSSADWLLVPTPCAGLGAALPAVARRALGSMSMEAVEVQAEPARLLAWGVASRAEAVVEGREERKASVAASAAVGGATRHAFCRI